MSNRSHTLEASIKTHNAVIPGIGLCAIMQRPMEMVTKPTLRATERLGQTVAALARLLDQTMNEIQAVNSEFQERILQTAQETEASLRQEGAERLKSATEEAEHNTRALITKELQTRFKKEMAAAVEAVRNELISGQVGLIEELERLWQA